MTMPDERTRAFLAAHKFLLELLDSKRTPGVPRLIRQRASGVLRHFPSNYDLWAGLTGVAQNFDVKVLESSLAPDPFPERQASKPPNQGI